jgi:hypothetical protein
VLASQALVREAVEVVWEMHRERYRLAETEPDSDGIGDVEPCDGEGTDGVERRKRQEAPDLLVLATASNPPAVPLTPFTGEFRPEPNFGMDEPRIESDQAELQPSCHAVLPAATCTKAKAKTKRSAVDVVVSFDPSVCNGLKL